MIVAMRPHGSESYSLLAKQLFVWPYPYNKVCFLAFLINCDSVKAVLLSAIFPVTSSTEMILITDVITSLV